MNRIGVLNVFEIYQHQGIRFLNVKTMNGREKMSKKRLIFVGLGLYDETDISFKGLQEIKQCDKVFAEFYTTKLGQVRSKSV